MFCSIYFQIKWLNDGLKRFDVSYCVPVFQSFWISVSVVSGMVFYREYEQLSASQAAWFVFAVLVTIVGVVGLSQRSIHSEQLVQLDTLNTTQYSPVKEDASEKLEISLSSESERRDSQVHSRTPSFDCGSSKPDQFGDGETSEEEH